MAPPELSRGDLPTFIREFEREPVALPFPATVIASSDDPYASLEASERFAKGLGARTLFLAHRRELIDQAAGAFAHQWPGVSVGRIDQKHHQADAHVTVAIVARWAWSEREGALRIASPYLPAGHVEQSADAAELQADGGFILRGRLDRIVKLEEKRVCLHRVALLYDDAGDAARGGGACV